MTTLFEQNSKLTACPKAAEESWKRTDPEIFFLPDNEVLNIYGQSAIENKNKLNPWKVCFQDPKLTENKLNSLTKYFGESALIELKNELNRLILVEINHGQSNVYMPNELKSSVEFMSSPVDIPFKDKKKSINHALMARIQESSPHKMQILVTSKNQEEPLFLILNHLEPSYSQCYNSLQFNLANNSKAQFIMLEGGREFSLFHHEIHVGKNSQLQELWIHQGHLNNHKSIYLNRLVTLEENAQFQDAQFFKSENTIRINSKIQLLGMHSHSESGSFVYAQKGSLDYEPIQEHIAEKTNSKLKLNMILNGKSIASFQGLISAHQNANNCKASQENKNIICSKTARVNAEPRLEILPHDINCKHGSASGELDSKQLYYLQTRGFTLEQAQKFILKSFALSCFYFLNDESIILKTMESMLENDLF